MAEVALMDIEGVLARGPLPNAQPITDGLLLYRSLAYQYKVALRSTTFGQTTTGIQRWLDLQGIKNAFAELAALSPDEPLEWLRTLKVLRAETLNGVALVVTSDPRIVRVALQQGITALLFAHPKYLHPEWRPDNEQGLRSWEEIVEEQRTQGQLKEKDPRLTADLGRPD